MNNEEYFIWALVCRKLTTALYLKAQKYKDYFLAKGSPEPWNFASIPSGFLKVPIRFKQSEMTISAYKYD